MTKNELKHQIENRVEEAGIKAREILAQMPITAGLNEQQFLGLYQMIVFRLLGEKQTNNNI